MASDGLSSSSPAGSGGQRLNHDAESDGPPAYLLNFGDDEDPDLERLLAEGLDDDIVLAGRSPRRSPARQESDRNKGKGPSRDTSLNVDAATLPVSRPTRQPPRTSNTTNMPFRDEDDDVPESLLLEGKAGRRTRRKSRSSRTKDDGALLPPPVPGPDTSKTRGQWERTRRHHRLHSDGLPFDAPVPVMGQGSPRNRVIADPAERARWMFANIDNHDAFVSRVYYYFEEHGIWSIILSRAISGLTAAFVYCLSTFVFYCVDWSLVPGATRLSQVRVAQCTRNLPFWWNMVGFGFMFSMVVMAFNLVREYHQLMEIHDFYRYMLDIPDTDIQTVSWQYVISKIMELRDANLNTALNISPSTRKFLQLKRLQRMDAHDIANRLMRRENYWIAMINKDILDFTVTFPFLGKKTIYTRSLEWNISVALMDWVFDDNGNVRPEFRTASKRAELVTELQKRFFNAGFISIILALPLAAWSVALRFLKSYTEYQKNPGELAARKFTLLAEWKIRDFNEVNHLFDRRKKKAYLYANRYLDQFPKDKLSQFVRFVAFIVGALAAVLGVVTLWDPELFLGFDIAGKTVLFWIGIFGTLFVICRNAASDDEDDVWDPEMAMEAVIYHTHYCPDSWKGRLYTEEVRREFVSLYKLEALLFLEEVVGSVIAPFMLMFSLPRCAGALVDFFREFTIDVDGLGTVCSYAVFNFQNGGKAAPRPGQEGGAGLRDGYYGDKANKLMESYLSFLDAYATNPTKRGGGRGGAKRPFHPPPTFPGMGALGAGNLHGSMVHMEPQQGISRAPTRDGAPPGLHHQVSTLRQSVHNTPRFGPAAGSTTAVGFVSPMHSILLDPHHQPRHSPTSAPSQQHAQTAARRSHPAAALGTSTLRQHHALDNDPIEETDDSQHIKSHVQRTTSNLLDEDTELGESWLLKGGGASPGGSGRREDSDQEGAGGVLGMLMQFQGRPQGKGGHI
jgi:autophagy-related protein 9